MLYCLQKEEVFKTSSSINVINFAIDVAAVKVNPGVSGFSYAKTTDVVNFGASKFYYAELCQRSITAVTGVKAFGVSRFAIMTRISDNNLKGLGFFQPFPI